MKNKHVVSWIVIALVVMATMSAFTVRRIGKISAAKIPQGETTVVPDSDTVDQQVGNQTDNGAGTEVNGAEATPENTEPAGQTADTEADQSTLQTQAKISVEQAQQAALATHPGGTILKTGLDDENGTLVYSVEFTDGVEVKVDAMTGIVLPASEQG